MVAQKGVELLLKGETAIPATYANIGGFRTNSMTVNGEGVDVTNKDSLGFKELLDGAGIRSMSTSASGVFVDDAQFALANTDVLAGTIRNYQLIIPDFGTYAGAFLITSLELAGENGAEVTYSISLESSGVITFTPA